MATKYEVIELDHNEVIVDVSLLRKSESLFFNATKMAKPFEKQVAHFLILGSTQEFIEVVLKKENSYNKNSYNKNLTYDDLVRIKKGRYGGTWLHKELAFEFAGWLSPIFRYDLYKWAEDRIEQERFWKLKRLETRTGYAPMTLAIMGAHDDPKFYHYSNETDMINRIIFGLSAKEFKKLHNVEDVRENLTAAELANLKRLQETNTGLIEAEMGYAERKEFLSKLHQKRIAKQIA